MTRLSEIFLRIAELGEALGVRRINQLPACWEYQLDEHWWIAVNGHSEPQRCSKAKIEIPPYHAYIEFNGWPAGLISPKDGTIAAGEAANETTLLQAIERRIAEKP